MQGGAGFGGAGARSGGAACGVGPNEDCTACGVGCGGGGGSGALTYVGGGQGAYTQETTYQYIGHGGDFDVVRPRRDFTCIITGCCLLSLLLLIPLLLWLLSMITTTSLPFNCDDGTWQMSWSTEKSNYCCMTSGKGCTTVPTTAFPETQPPTSPPTPFMTPAPVTQPPPPVTRPPPPPRPVGPVDPHNCAIGAPQTWSADKQTWCCNTHHVGCATAAPIIVPAPAPVAPVLPVVPAAPADPYNCADGFANWVQGWSVGKKAWCCKVHGKGCPTAAGGCETSAPYDCNAGFANWMSGWSVAKKAWCCSHGGKGCPPTAGGCA